MKTILRIILIVLVASMVAGAFSLAVNNNASTAGSNNFGQPLVLNGSNGQQFVRPEGGERDDGPGAGDFGGVLGTLLEITGMTILILMLRKAWSQRVSIKWKYAQR